MEEEKSEVLSDNHMDIEEVDHPKDSLLKVYKYISYIINVTIYLIRFLKENSIMERRRASILLFLIK